MANNRFPCGSEMGLDALFSATSGGISSSAGRNGLSSSANGAGAGLSFGIATAGLTEAEKECSLPVISSAGVGLKPAKTTTQAKTFRNALAQALVCAIERNWKSGTGTSPVFLRCPSTYSNLALTDHFSSSLRHIASAEDITIPSLFLMASAVAS